VWTTGTVSIHFSSVSPSESSFFLGHICFHYSSKYSLQIFRVLSLYHSVLWSCFSTLWISSHQLWTSSRLYFSSFFCVMAWNLLHSRELCHENVTSFFPILHTIFLLVNPLKGK
jgi:hypothetical protein